MKNALAILLFIVSACFFSVPTSAQDLSQLDWSALAAAESACGPYNTKFVVETQGGPHKLQQPDPGKALVYIIEQNLLGVPDVTARVGLDSAWVGATRGNSYLFFSVDPGEHHLCTDWISGFLPNGRIASLAPLMAEAGKTYYFRLRISPFFDLDPVNRDQGKLLIASSLLSISHPKK
jgi:hypothetical protein